MEMNPLRPSMPNLNFTGLLLLQCCGRRRPVTIEQLSSCWRSRAQMVCLAVLCCAVPCCAVLYCDAINVSIVGVRSVLCCADWLHCRRVLCCAVLLQCADDGGGHQPVELLPLFTVKRGSPAAHRYQVS